MVAVFDKITTKDQKLFLANVVMLVKASSYEELENNVEAISSVLKRVGCIKGEMPWEQEDGLCDCLPCGYMKKFLWQRAMPSEAIAILIPFNVKEMQMKNATYYGLNVLSNNIIIFDRLTGLINPAGFVLACPGAGKSFFVKKELIDVFLRYSNADILIIDPEREYWKLVEAFGGTVKRRYLRILTANLMIWQFPYHQKKTRTGVPTRKSVIMMNALQCQMTPLLPRGFTKQSS